MKQTRNQSYKNNPSVLRKAMDTKDLQRLLDELQALKDDVRYIKEHMVDKDTIMDEDETRKYEQSLAEFREKKTTSLADVKAELGL